MFFVTKLNDSIETATKLYGPLSNFSLLQADYNKLIIINKMGISK